MDHFILFGAIALALIVLKHILQVVGYLDIMPGPRYIDHSHLIVLIAIPPVHWSVYVLHIFGWWCLIDDYYQERRRKKSMDIHLRTGDFPPGLYYTSPLHRFGKWLGVI